MEIQIKQQNVKIKQVKKIKKDVLLINFFSSYIARKAQPGSFLHIKIKSVILRRPFSIHRIDKNYVYILFRIRGRGTKVLSQVKKGDVLDVIGPLGKPFQANSLPSGVSFQNILVAGGMGVAPLVFLAQKLRELQGTKDTMRNLTLLGAKNKKEILCENEFRKLKFKIKVATDDGSYGYKGTVIDLLKNVLSMREAGSKINIYTCGPKEMFLEIKKILKKYPEVKCQISFEQFMGCGLGICCGCVITTKNGYKKVCKDGPVFDIKEI